MNVLTCQDWLLSALGIFSQNMIVSTLYTNLGEEAVSHGLRETEVSVVITSHTLLPTLRSILSSGKCPLVKHVIYMEDPLFSSSPEVERFPDQISVRSFQSVVDLGKEKQVEAVGPSAEDLAVIMYTSGSTGVPKGVLLSHRNLVSTSSSIFFLRHFSPADTYIAYLPLAHVLELLSEITFLLMGVPIGYSSPNTMTDMSTAIKKGEKGDVSLLRPTIMCSVPLIMDRIQKNLREGIRRKGANFEALFQFCYDYKLRWNRDGYTTPILNRLVFDKLKAVLGGRVNFMLAGSAPLSPDTQVSHCSHSSPDSPLQEFLRTCLDIDLVQGFSMTETTCTGTVQTPGTRQVGLCGGPMWGLEVRLVNWEEGGYRISDNPPRGELQVGGNTVARGYFKVGLTTRQGSPDNRHYRMRRRPRRTSSWRTVSGSSKQATSEN